MMTNEKVILSDTLHARPLSEWHEDLGDVLWWVWPVEESPYCGTPLSSDWPGYHPHWTKFVVPTFAFGAHPPRKPGYAQRNVRP
jgi:hypothetical protein